MPVFNNALAGAAGSGGAADYKIERSLRFNSADSAYLSRTPSSAGNRKTWTWSAWVKKGDIISSGRQRLFSVRQGTTSNQTYIQFRDDNKLYVEGPAIAWLVNTDAVFRDPGAWGHVVVAFDTTQSTASNRVRIYWNGVEQSLSGTFPTQNYADSHINNTLLHSIGNEGGAVAEFFNGYLAEIHFVDGQQLTADDFGEFDADTGVWNPKKFSGSHGTNGFHLDFDPTAGTTYSNGVSSTSTANSSYPASNGFDGSVGSSGTANWYTQGSNQTITVDLSSYNVTASSSVGFNVRLGGPGNSATVSVTATIGGTAYTQTFQNSSTQDQLLTFSGSGAVTTIVATLTQANTSYGWGFTGVQVDGSYLVDQSAPGVDASGSGNHWTPNNLGDSLLYRGTPDTGGLDGYMPSGVSPATDPSQLADTTNRTHFFVVNQDNSWNLTVVATATSITTGSSVYDGWGSNNPTTTLNNGTVTPNSSGTDTSVSGKNLATNTFTGLTVGNTYTISTKNGGAGNPHRVHYVTGATVQNQPIVDTNSLLDSPTNYEADSGNNGGNYCTLNPLESALSGLNNGNLNSGSSGAASWKICTSTMAVSSGKYYWEGFTDTTANSSNGWQFGFCQVGPSSLTTPYGAGKWSHQGSDVFYQGSSSGLGSSSLANDLVAYALDMDAGTCKLYRNNSLIHTFTGITGTITPFVGSYGPPTVTVNFGQRPFTYTPPTGYKSLCTQNLADLTIADGSDYFDTLLWTGDGASSTREITGLSMKNAPDWVWAKERNGGSSHALFDSVRGFGTNNVLKTNSPDVEGNSNGGYINSTSKSSITWAQGSSAAEFYDANGKTYVAWCWDGGDLATNSTYNQDQVWSSGGGSGLYTGSTWGPVFNGSPATSGSNIALSAYVTNSGTSTLTFATAISGTLKATVCQGSNTPGTGADRPTVTLSDGSVQYVAAANSSPEVINFGSVSNITTLTIAGTSAQGMNLIKLELDNKELVDAGVIPVGSLNSTVYNTSQNWSVAGSNMQNNWSASFDGDTDPHFALPNTGYSASMTFPSAISYQTLELLVARDLYAPDLLVNGNNLNVPKTDTNTTGGRYKIERYYFTNGTLTSIGHETRNTAGRGGSGFWQIIVDGKILVDNNQASNAPNVPSIPTTCTSNPTAGFAISTYKGDSNDGASIAHNLGSTPEMVIIKPRNKSDDWRVYHVGAGNPYYLRLQLGNAGRSGTNNWREMSLNYFALDADSAVNSSSYDYVAFSFSSVPGFSHFGSYTGSGSQQFVHLGFRPAWVMIKRFTDNTVGEWGIYDSTRASSNEIQKKLWANNASSEEDHPNNSIDFVSNGFVIDPGSDSPNVQYTNNGSVGYLYAAFAEHPFKYARAR